MLQLGRDDEGQGDPHKVMKNGSYPATILHGERRPPLCHLDRSAA
jgi:hypothetical protein